MGLLEYVKAVVDRKIAEKRERGIFPRTCTYKEILGELTDSDVIDCMRQLHLDGYYRASLNKDKVPMLIDDRKEDDNGIS